VEEWRESSYTTGTRCGGAVTTAWKVACNKNAEQETRRGIEKAAGDPKKSGGRLKKLRYRKS
jgi:hypothetical protein